MFTTYRQRVIGFGVSTIGAVAATVALAAPHASAAALSVAVEPGSSFGLTTSFGTGCNYKVTAAVSTPGGAVYFMDNGSVFTGFNPNQVEANAGIAETVWTPATPGVHVISAYHGVFPNGTEVAAPPITVGTGINTGSGCAVLP
ncbi:hypothetical protein [Nocardia sp. NPDC058705]|uniref:hypothetical protein n=1 Tax=Nocardia sp. NPDC058705 TaxID=3346609 RepID=UPI003684E0A2